MPNTFVDGMRVSKPREGAPDFIKLNISIKVDDFIPFAKKHAKNGWLNIDLKKSSKGTLYTALNEYQKREKTEEKIEEVEEETSPLADIPF